MVKKILDYLDTGESEALASFLVELLGLEETVRIALITFYALPERQEQFEDKFLDRMTLGAMVQRLRPVIDHIGASPKERRWLNEVVDVRNVVAHSLPTSAVKDEDLDPATYRVYETKTGPLRVEDLEPYTVMALKLRVLLSLPWREPA